MRTTGLKTCRPKKRSPLPLRSASSAIESEEVVVARAASRAAAPTAASSSTLASTSSVIASTIRSQSARSAGSVVTLIRSGAPRSSFRASPWAFSSARHAEASLRASRRTVPVCVAQAASPQAISPLPATPGRSYPAEPPIRRVTITRERIADE